LIIAHRLASVKKVSRIIVMDQGRIVETGAPEDLSQQSGWYDKLVNLQFNVQ